MTKPKFNRTQRDTSANTGTVGTPAVPVAAISPKALMLPYQRRFADDAARFKIAVMSRQTGKSFCTAEEAVENCLTEPGAMWV